VSFHPPLSSTLGYERGISAEKIVARAGKATGRNEFTCDFDLPLA
jgi:hypothetical protein